MNKRPRILLVARYYVIEPLGLLYLAGLASSIGCEVDVELVPDNDFSELYARVASWKPDFVGFQIWTGWHLQTFVACDRVRRMGTKVLIGGPHATYFTDECGKHADWVVRGEAFRSFRRILQGELPPGVHFDKEQLADGFPMPNREIVYHKYPLLRDSRIRSIITSLGCPYACSYCYAPEWNKMYFGFDHHQRPVDELIREALEIRDRWGAQMVYFQDDIFGYSMTWLADFAERWPKEVGIPWHCQVRLELTRHAVGDRRLDLFKKGGCTGITLAIESGDPFLREHVLNRPMSEELILEGCAKIKSRGITLRLEQILAIPFSTLETDLSTLRLNNVINPEMAWTSILAPYGGTLMGEIANSFGFYKGNNDDLHQLFFDRSVMRHSKTARHIIEPVVRSIEARRMDSPLRRMEAQEVSPLVVDVYPRDTRNEFSKKHLPGPAALCRFEFMDDAENEWYADQTVVLQRLFMWCSLVPKGDLLAEKFVSLPRESWTWPILGQVAKKHFEIIGRGDDAKKWEQELTHALRCSSPDELPRVVRDNPYYFTFFPSSAEFAEQVIESGAVNIDAPPGRQFDELGGVARRWLFERSLYKIVPASEPIAKQ